MTSRWSAPYGYRHVLSISLPLVISMGSLTLMQFTDRIFLASYSLEAIAAVLPAGITAFLFECFFMGVASYVNVFVAQYTGRGAHHRVGAALWQGLYFSMAATVILALISFAAPWIFQFAGHPGEVRLLEEKYFFILLLGGGFVIFETTLGCFFSGRGLTRTVMLVNITGAGLNIPLDYCLINGIGPFPEMGIVGAAIATVFAFAFMTVFYCVLIFTKTHEKCFNVRSLWRFDRDLYSRLMKFGLPGGVQFFVEIFAVTLFVFLVGRLGKVELAATNIAFSIDSLAFLPSIGFSIGLSILTGQALGADEPEKAVYATGSTIRITLFYMVLIGLVFVFFPEFLVKLFQPRGMSDQEFAPVLETGKMLMRFVAAYVLIDGVTVTYFGTLKGAGDSRFIMLAMATCSILGLALPVYLAVEVFHASLATCWVLLAMWISSMAVTFYIRFKRGAWKGIRVIEERAVADSGPACG